MTPVCRFAPSPNGPLHLGHAYSALRNAAVARRCGGRLLLRMDNLDLARCPPGREAAIEDDLAWLGLSWERPVRRQSEHVPLYRAALERLEAKGLLYPCFCTRGDILRATGDRPDWPRDPDGVPLYPGTCRELGQAERAGRYARGTGFSLRLDGARAQRAVGRRLRWTEFGEGEVSQEIEARPSVWGDPVLQRKDTPASYHVAVVVDDADQGVTDIVRGTDLYAATALHRMLQVLLERPAPRYHHHRLITGEDGRKLSKSHGAPALGALRDAGLTPDDVRRMIEAQLALPPPAVGSGE